MRLSQDLPRAIEQLHIKREQVDQDREGAGGASADVQE